MAKKTILIVGDSYTYGQGCEDRISYYDKKLEKQIGKIFQYPEDPASKYCWATLLQEQLPQYDVINLASPGNSQFGIFKNLTDYLNENDNIELVLFNTTFNNRIPVADFEEPDKIISWSPQWVGDVPIHNPTLLHTLFGEKYKSYENAKQYYMKYLMNDEIIQYQSLMAILSAHSLATLKNIKFFWSTPETIYDCIGEMTPVSYPAYKSLINIEHLRYTHVSRYDFSGKLDRKYNVDNYHFLDGHINTAGHKFYFEKELFPFVKKILNSR